MGEFETNGDVEDIVSELVKGDFTMQIIENMIVKDEQLEKIEGALTYAVNSLETEIYSGKEMEKEKCNIVSESPKVNSMISEGAHYVTRDANSITDNTHMETNSIAEDTMLNDVDTQENRPEAFNFASKLEDASLLKALLYYSGMFNKADWESDVN